jgi:hypothetical protein
MNSTEFTYNRYQCEMPDASNEDSISCNLPGRDGVSIGVYLLVFRKNFLLPSALNMEVSGAPSGLAIGYQTARR